MERLAEMFALAPAALHLNPNFVIAGGLEKLPSGLTELAGSSIRPARSSTTDPMKSHIQGPKIMARIRSKSW